MTKHVSLYNRQWPREIDFPVNYCFIVIGRVFNNTEYRMFQFRNWGLPMSIPGNPQEYRNCTQKIRNKKPYYVVYSAIRCTPADHYKYDSPTIRFYRS